jgi:outer membrane protein assembly factor BamA
METAGNYKSNHSVNRNCKLKFVHSQLFLGAKLKHLFAALFFLTTFCSARAQSYLVRYRSVDADTAIAKKLSLQTAFASRTEAAVYLFQLPMLLQAKGYITASVDTVSYDSTSALAIIYPGGRYQWAKITTEPKDAVLLHAIQWPERSFEGTIDFTSLKTWQQRILDYLEENGHPFGKVYLDSININEDHVNALLKIEQGPLYKVDSIRVFGDAKIDNEFLQRYLDIPNGSIYNKTKLERVSQRLSQISYVVQDHAPTVDYLGTGSVLNLYLRSRKNNQANALIGFLPNSDASAEKKLLLTVDANILLRNALGGGETIGLIWQQLQQKSPRLNLLYEQPYIFHSPFGFNFTFDMYKRDSSFLNIIMNLGTMYRLEERQTIGVFLQRTQSIISVLNEGNVIQTRKLPPEADVSAVNLGLSYDFHNTDLRYNPRKGNEVYVSGSAGTKKLKKNNQILELEDPSDPGFNFEHLYDTIKLRAYQFRVVSSASHFIPLGVQSTLKLGVSAGIYQSANYFRNELFQIGGYKLMRGFDEGSQFVSQYAVGTMEYRYRLGLNSFLFAFFDGGWGKHQLEAKLNHNYLGTGVGLSLETKAGIINLAGAVGKRDDTEFNFREFKIHIGFASYF